MEDINLTGRRASFEQAMALADVREIMDTCSLGQALDLLKTKAAEQPLRSLVERSPELQQASGALCKIRKQSHFHA